MVVFGFLFLLTTRCWEPIRRGLGWLVLPLGQNALYAYATHVVLALALGGLVAHAGGRDPWTNAAIQAASVGLVWLAIRLRVLYPSAEHQRRWMASVVPLAVTALAVLPFVAPISVAPQPALDAPLSDAARHARAFGTPVPATSAANPLGIVPIASAPIDPVPVVEASDLTDAGCPASALPVVAEHGRGTAADYVGDIDGTFREVVFHSPALGRDMSYYVYLPPDYSGGARHYPVLYMLHGAGGDKDEWAAYGLVNDVDQLITSGSIQPLIVVMPQGDVGYWVNWANDGPRWGDYVAQDLRCHVDATSGRCRLPPSGRSAGCRWAAAGRCSLPSTTRTSSRSSVRTAPRRTSTTAPSRSSTAPETTSPSASRSTWRRTRRASSRCRSGSTLARTTPGCRATS